MNHLLFKLQSQRNEPLMTASPIYDGNSDNNLSFDMETEPIPSPQDLKEPCRYDGKPCYQKNPSHFIKYRHLKDNEGSENADKKEAKNESEIFDEFKRKQLQEAKDHEIAMHLSQASDSEDEYDKISKKPSAAFETNNTASVSRVFDEAELSENDDFPAPSTSNALPNRRNEIPDLSDDDDVITSQKIQEAKPKKSAALPDEGNIEMLKDMSFTREQAIKALKMTDNNVQRAVDWIFAHPGDINQETVSDSHVFPAPSTSYPLPNRRTEILDLSDDDDVITLPHCKP